MLPKNEKGKAGEDDGDDGDNGADRGDKRKPDDKGDKDEEKKVKKQKTDLKALLHVVYADFGDASILEFQSSNEKRFYLVDGGPIKFPLGRNRVHALTKRQLSKPYYQYLLYALTTLTEIPKTNEIKLDGALVTHPDADHIDGVERLFRQLLPHKYQEAATSDDTDKDQGQDISDKTDKDQGQDISQKRLICNGPVLLTKMFSSKGGTYRSFSNFLLDTEFEVNLDFDSIRKAFGNDVYFSFPTSPGVLYQRKKRSKDDKPYSKEDQKEKLKQCHDTPDVDKNKSSILLYTERGGKICLNGDAHGYDIAAMLVSRGVDNLDIFKLPHHGSPANSVLKKVMPPPWVFHNLAAMVLLSLSLNKTFSFPTKTEEESDINSIRTKLEKGSTPNGITIQQIADAFLEVLKEKLKNTKYVKPEILFDKTREEHIKILEAIQKPYEKDDPYKNLKPLEPLEDWKTLKEDVLSRLPSNSVVSSEVEELMGENERVFKEYFKGKVGIDAFFESFHSKTYYVSASVRYGHPSPMVIKGIIKAAVKKKKPCRIVFTSGGAVPSKNLPDANKDKSLKNWNKFVSLYYLKDNVSFKLDPFDSINTAPSGTTKFEDDDKIRTDVTAQLKENAGFTIPQRTFLPCLDKYYVKIVGSDHWLKVESDGKLILSSEKTAVIVSNANAFNGDLRVITLLRELDGNQKTKNVNVWLEKGNGGYLIQKSANGDYFFEENGSLNSTSDEDKAATFCFEHKIFPALYAPVQNEINVVQNLMEFLKSLGRKDEQTKISVQSVLETLLGISNVNLLVKNLPSDFIGIAVLDHEVNWEASSVEISSSVVISSKIEVLVTTPPLMFNSRQVTKLEIVSKDLCSSPSLSLLMSTTLDNISYTIDISEHLKPRTPTVDMYLNALGDVSKDNRSNMTLGILLQRVMGLLPLEALSNCLPSQLLSNKIFTWKVDRSISTVNYFISPLAVEVLSGDFYIVIPPEMKEISFGGTMKVDFSRIHVMVSDPRTEKCSFVVECDAMIGLVPVNLRMAPTSTNLPEVIISFSENATVASVFNILGLTEGIYDLSVPLVNKAFRSLQLSKPSICVAQDVQGYKLTRISSLSFEFSIDNFVSILPSALSTLKDSKASVKIFNPVSSQRQVGFEVEFKLPVPSSSNNNAFLNSKFSLWPIDASNHQSPNGYATTISLWPSPSGISIESALQAVGLRHQISSMTTVFPFFSNLLSGVLLDQISLEVNCQKKTIDSFSLSLVVPECSIIKGKLTMQEATFLVQYGSNQWYAEAEMKLLVFNKFVCSAAFSLPRPDVSGSLTFENTDDSLTINAFLEGIGISVPDLPIINEVLDVSISRVALNCENDGSSFKLTKVEAVIRKRTLTIGSIGLYNLELGILYAISQGSSSVSLSLQGYLNPKMHATLAYDAERRELLGHYIVMENISTNECLDNLFDKEKTSFSSSSAFQQVKSLHVQEAKVVLNFPRGKGWSLRKFLVNMKGSLSLGPFNLNQLRLVYMNDQTDEAKRDVSVVGYFKSADQTVSFMVELSCTSNEAKGTTFEASIKPDYRGGLTLSSLLRVVGLTSPVDDVPQVDGSPDFLNIELQEAFVQFEISPFRIRKLDVVVRTTTTIKILEKPLIQLQKARLEYHLDKTKDPAQTEIFIAGSFFIGKLRLNVTLKKDAKQGLVLEGRLNEAESSKKIDFEKAAKQLSPDVPFSLPHNVALSSLVFTLERSAETTSIKLEGESHTKWIPDFSTITIKNLGGKLSFKRDKSSDAWTGSVYLTGSIFVQESVPVTVVIYHDNKEGTVVFGNVNNPEAVDLNAVTQRFAAASDSSKSWQEIVPNETKTTVRSPKFTSAALLIDISEKSLMFYGSVHGFGTGLLMVKKTATDANESTSKYGFLFGLSLGADFRFSAIDQSLCVVDEVISVKHANLAVISMKRVTVKEMVEGFSKLKLQEHGEHQKQESLPFSDLDKQTISMEEMKQGITLFAEVNVSDGGGCRLSSNVAHIQEGKPTEIILFAHIAEKAIDTLFMAKIKKMTLFGGHLTFKGISLTYQPSKGKSFTLDGSMSLMLTLDPHSQPIIFHGTLKISESQADFSMGVESEPGTIHEPFGMFGISFEDPQLHLTWKFDPEKKQKGNSSIPICSISGSVKFSKSDSTSKKNPVTLKASILFQNGKPEVAMISFEPSHPLSIDDFFITLFGKNWPSGYLDISFKKGEIYYAKGNVEISGKKYDEGFRGETEIEVYDHAFGVELSIDKTGIEIKGYTESEIDLDVATITGKDFDKNKGPEIDISHHDGSTTFQLSAGIKILQEEIGSCSLSYDIQQKCFTGIVTYSGKLLGFTNPSIEFEWSHKGGFKILKWPANLDLENKIQFDKEFQTLSKKGPCKELVKIAFGKVISTKCNVHAKQASPDKSKDPNAWFALKIQGTIDIIIGGKKSLQVDFPELIISITQPKKHFRLSDLPGFLKKEILKNSQEIAKQVLKNPEKLTKFIAALGSIQFSKQILSGLICRKCRSKNVTDEVEKKSDDMEQDTKDKEDKLDSASDKLSEDIEGDASLGDLAADAGEVIDTAGDVLSAIGAILSFFKEFATFFTGKSKKQKEAEEKKKKAEEKRSHARMIVENRLVIKNLKIASHQDEVEVTWKHVGEKKDHVKYVVKLWCTDISGENTCLLEKTTENNKVTVKSVKLKFDIKQFKASIQATIEAKSCEFKGEIKYASISVIPLLPPPSQLEVESKRDGREVHVSFSPVKFATEYKVEVVKHDHDHDSTIDSAIVKLGSEDKKGTLFYVFDAEQLTLGVPGNYQVGVCSLKQDTGPQEFKYSADLYLVAAPSDVDFSYEPTSQQLSVNWKVSSNQKILRYLCEIQSVDEAKTVVFSNDKTKPKDVDSLESNLQIKLSEIKDVKAKSPYCIRVCSLGEQETLASVFVRSKAQLSFQPQVQDISTSYDPQSNQLKVTWSPVTGASKYEVTVTDKTDNSIVARTFIINEGKTNPLVFEMDRRLQLKLRCGRKYAVSLINEGSDALHLPSVPSTAITEFALLPKPTYVTQEYSFKEKMLKVTFKPVPEAQAHLIEIFNKTLPREIQGKHVVPKPANKWPTTMTYSFHVSSLTFQNHDSGPFKSRVIAQGNANWINSVPCVSPTELKRSKPPTSVALTYDTQTRQLNILISSIPGQFTATVEDSVHKSRQVTKQRFLVRRDATEPHAVHQTLLKVPLNLAREPQGATYQASVVNDGDQECLPSGIKKSNDVLLLDPPASVTQEYRNGVVTVAWKCVKSAVGYSIKVYNTKTKITAAEERITSDLRPVGKEMKKEFASNVLLLQSNGLYQTMITVMGNEYSIGGASTTSTSTIPSFSAPKDVNIVFNNETRQMCISCSPVNDTVSIKLKLGVIDTEKVKTSEGNVEKALLASKVVTCPSDHSKPFEAEFDESNLPKSLDSAYKAVAQTLDIQGKISLPSGFSISHDEVAWLKPADPIHIYFDPCNSTVKITWTTVHLATGYLVELLQTREDDKGKKSTLIPFSQDLSRGAAFCNVDMKNIVIEENDRFKAKVQPRGKHGCVITTDSIGYSSETLVRKNPPFNVEVLQLDDEAVSVVWEGLSRPPEYQLGVCKMSGSIEERVFTKEIRGCKLESTPAALHMSSPGWYKFEVRALGSIDKLPSVYAKSDFCAFIMATPRALQLKPQEITLKWNQVHPTQTYNFSNYVIWYQPKRDVLSGWKHIKVGLSKTEKTIKNLQPNQYYLFCISVQCADDPRKMGIRSPFATIRTGDAEVKTSVNLIDNPNFQPIVESSWQGTGYSYSMFFRPWDLHVDGNNPPMFRLERDPPGQAKEWPEKDVRFPWCIAAGTTTFRRVQTIDLHAKGFTPHYLDKIRPPIDAYEWFYINQGPQCVYQIKVSLLDSNKTEIHVPFSKSISPEHGDGLWKRLGYTFTNYPDGLRFIRFEDGLESILYNVKAFQPTVEFLESAGTKCDTLINEQINFYMQVMYVFFFLGCCKYDTSLSLNSKVLLVLSKHFFSQAEELMRLQENRGGQLVLQDVKKPDLQPLDNLTELKASESALELAKQIKEKLQKLTNVAEENHDQELKDFIDKNLLDKQDEDIQELAALKEDCNSISREMIPEVETSVNLIVNPNFQASGGSSWQGCSLSIATSPWDLEGSNVIGYRLERDPPGQAKEWPEKDVRFPWCIAAASLATPFRRVQTIDLLAKSFTPQYLDKIRPPIDAYEWFFIKQGGFCAYEIKVSLLDKNKTELQEPFKKRISPEHGDGLWKRLGHTFTAYPAGLRFIRFEDDLEGLLIDMPGLFDVKAFEPTVTFLKSAETKSETVRKIYEEINFELQALYAFLFIACSTSSSLNSLLLTQCNICFTQAQRLMSYLKNHGEHIVLEDIKKPDPQQWNTSTDRYACESALTLIGQMKEKLQKLGSLAKVNDKQELKNLIDEFLDEMHKSTTDINRMEETLKRGLPRVHKLP